MGILGSLLGKRERQAVYRTIDGGHPAPFPDMTDEQLYNYETVFNVQHKTFDKPPPSMRKETVEAAAALEETFARRARAFDAPRYTARRASGEAQQAEPPRPAPQPLVQDNLPPPDLGKPVRLVTTRQPVEIITTRARHPVYKVHAYVGDDAVVTVFTLDGRLSENGPRYLENVPEEPPALYLNVYPNTGKAGADKYVLTQHATREAADAAAKPGRVACVPLHIG